jgi:hypothetical protein
MVDRHLSRPKRPRCASVSVDNLVDYPVGTFTNVSAAHEKVAQIANLLKEWHWSFTTLIKHWLTYKDGQQGMRSARKKADLLRVLLIEDAKATYKELKKHDLLVGSMELATTFVVNGIEMSSLRCETLWSLGDEILDLTSNSLIFLKQQPSFGPKPLFLPISSPNPARCR